jgi:hypothetical protein
MYRTIQNHRILVTETVETLRSDQTYVNFLLFTSCKLGMNINMTIIAKPWRQSYKKTLVPLRCTMYCPVPLYCMLRATCTLFKRKLKT